MKIITTEETDDLDWENIPEDDRVILLDIARKFVVQSSSSLKFFKFVSDVDKFSSKQLKVGKKYGVLSMAIPDIHTYVYFRYTSLDRQDRKNSIHFNILLL